MAGEFEFIEWVRRRGGGAAGLVVPSGDDMAALRWAGEDLLLVGVDQVLDGVHFDAQVHGARAIGRKVMNRNLSDCAAMACLPVAAVVAVALPAGVGMDYARELYEGLESAATAFGCAIIGGDTAAWAGRLAMSVTVFGRSGGVAPITRGGARAGQGVYVTGPLGGSIRGRHMEFVPRIHEARRLAETGRVTAMIDISDGLSRDIGHICTQSGVGAVLDAAAIPIHPDALALSATTARPALEHALHDGEDHELLFTFDGELPAGLPGVRIGTTTAADGVRLREADGVERPLAARGWEHRL